MIACVSAYGGTKGYSSSSAALSSGLGSSSYGSGLSGPSAGLGSLSGRRLSSSGLGGLGSSLSGNNFASNAGPVQVQAAIQTRHQVQYLDVPIVSDINPTTIEVGASPLPVTILFRSSSSRLNVQQVHDSAQGSVQETSSEDEPHRLLHSVTKPIIQEVHEVITPFRKITQEIQPVQEEILTVVPRGQQQTVSAQAAPVLTQAAPVLTQAAPAVLTQSAPAVLTQSAPAVLTQSSPAVLTQSAPALVAQEISSGPLLITGTTSQSDSNELLGPAASLLGSSRSRGSVASALGGTKSKY